MSCFEAFGNFKTILEVFLPLEFTLEAFGNTDDNVLEASDMFKMIVEACGILGSFETFDEISDCFRWFLEGLH